MYSHKFFDKNSCFSPEHKEFCDIYQGWKFTHKGIIIGNNIPNDIKFTLTKKSIILIETEDYIKDHVFRNSPYIEFEYEVDILYPNENFIFVHKNKKENSSERILLENKQGIYKFIKYLKKGVNYFNWIYEKQLIPKFSNDKELISKFENAQYNSRNPIKIKKIIIFGSEEGEGYTCQKCKEVLL